MFWTKNKKKKKNTEKKDKCINVEYFRNKGFWFNNSTDHFFLVTEVVTVCTV